MIDKIINIKGKNIGLKTSEIKIHNESDNRFINIHIEDKDHDDITKYMLLHIGFSYKFLHTTPSAKEIDFAKIVDEEVRLLIEAMRESLFDGEEYFVYYTAEGRLVNHKFHPFMDSN